MLKQLLIIIILIALGTMLIKQNVPAQLKESDNFLYKDSSYLFKTSFAYEKDSSATEAKAE